MKLYSRIVCPLLAIAVLYFLFLVSRPPPVKEVYAFREYASRVALSGVVVAGLLLALVVGWLIDRRGPPK